MPMRWNAESLWEAIAPELPGFSVEILPELGSTNSELMRRAHTGAMDPVLLVAERQTAGRGRMGRTWQSAQETAGASLTFSLGLALAPQSWSGLSLAVGLAAAQALHPQLRLKWPNDMWLDGRKLGGILIETASLGDSRYVVIGMGLNIAPPATQGVDQPSACLQELLPELDAPATLALLALPLVRAVLRFGDTGFAPLREAYHARDGLYGQQVLCTDGSCGQARGVDAGGALLVHTAQGLKKITSAEVSVRPTPLPLDS